VNVLQDLPALARAAQDVLTPFVLTPSRAPELTRALRPKPEDYRLMFRADLADRVATLYDGLWAQNPVIEAKPHQTALMVKAALGAMFFPGSTGIDAFPGGYRGIGDYLVGDRVWVVWKFVAPGSTLGMAYDGLVHLDGRWVWCPRPYAILRKVVDEAS
jgi:hypothetical protein